MGKGFFTSNNDVGKQETRGGNQPGGLAGALGFEDDNQESGLMGGVGQGVMDELAMMEEEGMGSQSDSIKVTVFINFDEDDD